MPENGNKSTSHMRFLPLEEFLKQNENDHGVKTNPLPVFKSTTAQEVVNEAYGIKKDPTVAEVLEIAEGLDLSEYDKAEAQKAMTALKKGIKKADKDKDQSLTSEEFVNLMYSLPPGSIEQKLSGKVVEKVNSR